MQFCAGVATAAVAADFVACEEVDYLMCITPEHKLRMINVQQCGSHKKMKQGLGGSVTASATTSAAAVMVVLRSFLVLVVLKMVTSKPSPDVDIEINIENHGTMGDITFFFNDPSSAVANISDVYNPNGNNPVTCNQMSCSDNEECEDNGGTTPGTCQCLDEYVRDSSDNCVGTCTQISCKSDNEECEDNGGTTPGTCQCIDEYVRNSFNICVGTCSQVSCTSDNEECEDNGGTTPGTCQCIEEYVRDSSDNCVAQDYPVLYMPFRRYASSIWDGDYEPVNALYTSVWPSSAASSSAWPDYEAKKATSSSGGYWYPASGTTLPQTIWFKFKESTIIKRTSFTTVKGYEHLLPTEFIFFGSNAADCSDSSEWAHLELDKQTDYDYAVENSDEYTCYGFKITKAKGSTEAATISNLRLYVDDGNCTDPSLWKEFNVTTAETNPSSIVANVEDNGVLNIGAYSCYGFRITQAKDDPDYTSIAKLMFYGKRVYGCNGFWNNGQCLFRSSDHQYKDWNAAFRACADKGQILATIHDHSAIVRKTNSWGSTSWVGATDSANEGTWTWTDGTRVEGVPWANYKYFGYDNNPNGGTRENCMLVSPYGYADYDCGYENYYICALVDPSKLT